MDSVGKNRLATWAFLTLVALNLGLLSLIWYGQVLHPSSMPPPGSPGPDPTDFVIRELGLNNAQADSVRSLHGLQNIKSDSIRSDIHRLNRTIVEELFSAAPDSMRLHRLLDSVGARHAEFETNAYQHFLYIKRLCTPDQQEKLKSVILEALRVSDVPPPPMGMDRTGFRPGFPDDRGHGPEGGPPGGQNPPPRPR